MYARSAARNSRSAGRRASSAASTKQVTKRRPRSRMSPFPACIRSSADWSPPYCSVYRGGPPMTSPQYAARRSTWRGSWSGWANGWLSSGSARQRWWWAEASASIASSPPAYTNRDGRTRRGCHGPLLGDRAVVHVDRAVPEPVLVNELERDTNTRREVRRAAAHDLWHDEPVVLVDEAGVDRLGGEVRSADADIAFGSLLAPPHIAEVEVSLQPGP